MLAEINKVTSEKITMSGKDWLSEYRRPEFWNFLGISAASLIGMHWFLFRDKYDGPGDVLVRAAVILLFSAAFYPPFARYARRYR